MRRGRRLALAAAALLACGAAGAAEGAGFTWSGEARAHADLRSANAAGVLARADAVSPGLVAAPRDAFVLDAGLRGQGHGLSADLLLRSGRPEGGPTSSSATLNELYGSAAVPGTADAWHVSLGKKVVGWDVGYGWRPSDVVQQEPRRQLLATTPEGRPLAALEYFGAETAWTLVWVNPHHLHAGFERSTGSEESALALRAYHRAGTLDLHGFARWGEHTHGSLGAALAWVASESTELHASWRFASRRDGWHGSAPADATPLRANPWQVATLGSAAQWLLGGTWTNEAQLSVLAEAWHDGSAPSDAEWDAWQRRTDALARAGAAGPASLRTAFAANLAWQATPWQAQNLRRDNLFLRVTWQHEAWQPALDLLYTPADAGRSVTASLGWQGDRLHLEAGLRQSGGPATALFAQLPQRRSGYLLASYAF